MPEYERTVLYTLQGAAEIPEAAEESARRGADELREISSRLDTARAKASSKRTELSRSGVPDPPGGPLPGCTLCRYTKVVDFVLKEDWEANPNDPSCGQCGTKMRSSTTVINGAVRDVVEAWDFKS